MERSYIGFVQGIGALLGGISRLESARMETREMAQSWAESVAVSHEANGRKVADYGVTASGLTPEITAVMVDPADFTPQPGNGLPEYIDASVALDAAAMLRKAERDIKAMVESNHAGNHEMAERYRVSAVANMHAALARLA